MKNNPKIKISKKSAVRNTRPPLSLVIVWYQDRSLKLLLFKNKQLISSAFYKNGAKTENFINCLDNFFNKQQQPYEAVKEIYLKNFSTSFSQIRLANIIAKILAHYSGRSFKQIKNRVVDLTKIFTSDSVSIKGAGIKYPGKAV